MGETLSILFEDAHLLVVAKPPDLANQGKPWLGPTLEQAIRHYLAPDDPSGVYLGIPHRLDRPVSGVTAWAKNPKSARRLAEQFADRAVMKLYWALVEAEGAEASGVWEDWLCEEWTGLGRVQVCAQGTPRARHARTRFERINHAQRLPEGCLFLALRPETGRTHQLRVQSGSRGMPVLGDERYGARRPFPAGIALHARSLTLRHPVLDRPITLEAPVPVTWATAGFQWHEAGSG